VDILFSPWRNSYVTSEREDAERCILCRIHDSRVAIVVFAIMLTERLVGERITQTSRHLVNGGVVAAGVFIGIAGFLIRVPRSLPRAPLVGDATPALGRALVGPFALTLELLGVLLVVALLGALYFARADE